MFVHSFITGSHAYGIPTEESDVDLVIYMSKDYPSIWNKLLEFAEEGREDRKLKYEKFRSECFYFGKLNIIACKDIKVWRMWYDGTEHLKKIGPVTREFACRYFDKLRVDRGI